MFRSDKDAKNGYLANVDAKHDLVKFFKFENGRCFCHCRIQNADRRK